MPEPILPPDQPLHSVVKLRVLRRQKSAWVRAAQKSGQTLGAWLTKIADEKAG